MWRKIKLGYVRTVFRTAGADLRAAQHMGMCCGRENRRKIFLTNEQED